MPTYVYQCRNGHFAEIVCPVSERPQKVRCPRCSKTATRIITGVQIQIPEIHRATYLTKARIQSQIQNIDAIEKEIRKGEPITVSTKDVPREFRIELDRRITRSGRAF